MMPPFGGADGQIIGLLLYRLLRWRFILVVTGLAALSMLGVAVFTLAVEGQDGSAAAVNMAGRQRMQAQRLATAALLLGETPPGAGRESLRAELRDGSVAFAAALRDFDLSIAGPVARSALTAILSGTQHPLLAKIDYFAAEVRAVADLPDAEIIPGHPRIHALARAASGEVLTGLDMLVDAIELASRNGVTRLRTAAAMGETLFLLLLAAMAWMVFRPLLIETRGALARLAAVERYHRSMVEALGDGIIAVDITTGRVESLNGAAKSMFGVMAGARLDSLIPDAAKLRTAGGGETEGRHIDGSSFPINLMFHHAPVDDHDRWLAVVRDLTSQVAAEERIRLLHHALEQSPASVVITDCAGAIQYVNPRFCAVSGYEREELLGQTPRLFKSGSTALETYHNLWTAITSGREWRGEMLNRKKNGELFWEAEAVSPLRNGRGEITSFIAIKEDITERKQIEQALIHAKQQAEEANRSKSDFLANMSHELRTPLNAVIGYADLMTHELFGPLGDAKYKDCLGAIHESGHLLLSLINELLDLSKIEAGKLELDESAVDIANLVQAVRRLVVERATGKGLHLAIDADEALPPFWGDELRLKQIMLNLLTNAVKFTPSGGTVMLKAGLDKDGGLFIAVADTGPGIAEADIALVLEPFGQARNPFIRDEQGTGLGLPLCKRLAELHGGRLALHSRLGEGTTVTAHFPPRRLLTSCTAVSA